MRRVIVDTNIFVDFFRGRPDQHFAALLRTNSVLLSPFVRLELLQGARKPEAKMLGDLLGGIPIVPADNRLFEATESILSMLKGSGLNAGLVDLLIAAQAQLLRCPVLSHDAFFAKLAARGVIRPF